MLVSKLEKVERNQEIYRLHDAGKTLVEISLIMGLSKQRVHQIVSRRGRDRLGPNVWSHDDITIALALNEIGVRHREIAEVLNRTESSISKQLAYLKTSSAKTCIRRSNVIAELRRDGISNIEIAKRVYSIDLR